MVKFKLQCVLFKILLHFTHCYCYGGENFSGNEKQLHVGQVLSDKRYLIYDVNPGEGFNLRRDVYVRVSNLIKILNEKSNWTLVVPPWRHLYHWKTHDIEQNAVPWKRFFDMKSLNHYVPVIDFQEFVNETGDPRIEETVYLQRYKEGWKDGKWEEKVDERECIEPPVYKKDGRGVYRGYFWGLNDVFTMKVRCMSVQGLANVLVPLLMESMARSIFIDRFEEVLHIEYGQVEYWKARRSMVFAKHLRKEGDKFRTEFLSSEDEKDSTVMKKDWRKNKKKEGSAKGGPYVALHLRRADFLYARANQVPTLDGAVKQIKKIMKEQKVDVVFLATDASEDDVKYLKEKLPIAKYEPSRSILEKYGDGGVAIIDQWICAHAKYFVGTKESTFSFRIQEERDILGFSADATFNCLCPDKEIDKCEQPTRWRIVY